MSTINEILSTGRYTDRRGRKWFKAVLSGRWESPLRIDPAKGQTYLSLNREVMRLLIERDQHRDVCEGADCGDHPVPIVRVNYIESGCVAWEIVPSGSPEGRLLAITHAEAMDAARALAATP